MATFVVDGDEGLALCSCTMISIETECGSNQNDGDVAMRDRKLEPSPRYQKLVKSGNNVEYESLLT